MGAIAEKKEGKSKKYDGTIAIDPFGTHLSLFHIPEEAAVRNHSTGERFDVTSNTADGINSERNSHPII